MSIVDTPTAPADATSETRIKCEICGAKVHSIQLHIAKDHAGEGHTLESYRAQFPEAPLLSEIARVKLEEKKRASAPAASVSADGAPVLRQEFFHEIFGLGKTSAALSARGQPIPITVMGDSGEFNDMVPEVDSNYVFNLDVLKSMMMAIEMRIPVYLWGHAGTGKTTIIEQIAARTKRPMLRVQHTANMEEEHIVGGWRLRDGKTFFEPGPLALAMIHGWTYLADEYDFGRPEVTSVYQSVLEYKPLVIKEADAAHRVIKPHPNFRFVGTGNTNGQGDETGLYQGTTIQNAAAYERFGVVEQMPYMEKALEARLISQQANIPLEDAKKLVDFVGRIRTEFDGAKIGNPISPRSLIYAAKIGVARMNYRVGLEKAYINRLSSVDRETAGQVAQRVFA